LLPDVQPYCTVDAKMASSWNSTTPALALGPRWVRV
jgi:hypothetical protein